MAARRRPRLSGRVKHRAGGREGGREVSGPAETSPRYGIRLPAEPEQYACPGGAERLHGVG